MKLVSLTEEEAQYLVMSSDGPYKPGHHCHREPGCLLSSNRNPYSRSYLTFPRANVTCFVAALTVFASVGLVTLFLASVVSPILFRYG